MVVTPSFVRDMRTFSDKVQLAIGASVSDLLMDFGNPERISGVELDHGVVQFGLPLFEGLSIAVLRDGSTFYLCCFACTNADCTQTCSCKW